MTSLIIIECTENCYSVSRKGVNQSQQITLSRLEWFEFIKHCDDVTSYMKGKSPQSKKGEEMSWSLATENSRGVETWARVSTKIRLFYIQRAPYCSIAVYEGATPSDQGVTLNQSEWEQVRISTSRSSSFNVFLAVETYQNLLKDAIVRALPKHCEGCKWNRINTMNHECHVNKDRLIRRAVKELADTDVSPHVFQHKLADVANYCDEELELSPGYLYDLCNYLFRPWCVDTVCTHMSVGGFLSDDPLGPVPAPTPYIRKRYYSDFHSAHSGVMVNRLDGEKQNGISDTDQNRKAGNQNCPSRISGIHR